MRCRPAVWPFLSFLPLLLLACELTEVEMAPGRRTVVVHSVISRTNTRQFVVVEYSQVGDTQNLSVPPFGGVRHPIRDATVTIEHLSAGPCAGQVNSFMERPQSDTLFAPGIYAGTLCSTEPGERMRLRVQTSAGEVVTGETTIPGAASRSVTVAGRSAGFPLDTLPMNRDRDTLRVTVTPVSGSALQIEGGNATFPGGIALYLITDSMGIAVAGDLVNPFEENGDAIFGAGRYYLFTVALTDSSYFDFVRSRSEPFTGRGFINRLDGGIGVFGSVEAETQVLRVVADVDDPREGVYHITGMPRGVSVDISLELYLNGPFFCSAFVDGAWLEGPVRQSGGGFFYPTSTAPESPRNSFEFRFFGPRTDSIAPRVYTLRGTRSADGTPFEVELLEFAAGRNQPLPDTLMAQQIRGPGQ